MKAILFANRDGKVLTPLTHKTCVAMLPIATKPLIEYALENLIMTHVRDVILVIADHADQVEQHVKSGERWGHNVEYILAQPNENPAQILKRNILTDDTYLLMRADMLQNVNLKYFLEQAQRLNTPEIIATINDKPIGVALLNQQKICKSSQLLNYEVILQQQSDHAVKIELEGEYALLDSLQNYFDTNLAVAQSQYKYLVVNGRQITETLRAGRRSKIADTHCGLVGDYCNIHPKAVLDNVVLGHEVIVDRYATIQNSLVLNNTYIAEGVEVKNAIVSGNQIIRLDLNAQVTLTDTLLVADLKQIHIGQFFSKLFSRTVGVILLLFSLPLWLLALLFSLLSTKQLLRKVELISNRQHITDKGEYQLQPFSSWEWSTQIPIFRYLPRLFAVITGHIHIVGVRPSLGQIYHNQPISVGLIGPSQVAIPNTAPQEEHHLAEIYYLHTRDFWADMMWLIRGFIALFTAKAWMPIVEED